MATQAELEKKIQEVEDYTADLEIDVTDQMQKLMVIVEHLITQNQMLTDILARHQAMFEDIQKPRLN